MTFHASEPRYDGRRQVGRSNRYRLMAGVSMPEVLAVQTDEPQ